MGLLDFDGKPLSWEEIEPHIPYVKKHGLIQFINSYNQMLERPRDVLKWGDEVNHCLMYSFSQVFRCMNNSGKKKIKMSGNSK